MTLLMTLRVLSFIVGVAIVAGTLLSATRTYVLPRSARDRVARAVFLAIRKVFDFVCRRAATYHGRDRIMALYAPISLLVLDAVWLVLVLIGYTMMFWALGSPTWHSAFTTSGSSLLTLGFAVFNGTPITILAFSEAMIGLTLVALLIAYLPTIYAAFSRREEQVTLLEVRAGSPPSALTMIERFHRIQGLDRLHGMWERWETWFANVEETHASLAALCFFRSPSPDRHWVTAAGVVLDAAALSASTLDIPHDAQADLCIRAGFIALRHIADFFRISYNPDPAPTDPISIRRAEFDAVCEELASHHVPLKADRDQAWRDFAGWRVNYDTALLALARLTMAPPGVLWSTDRFPAAQPRKAQRAVARPAAQR
jgi:hypothetical protein